jgi:putative ABC transport system permease protein
MPMSEISNSAMLVLIVFVFIPLSLSYMFSLGFGKTIIWSSFRGIVQLFLIGYILTFLFDLPSWQGIGMMLFMMVIVATRHASTHDKGIPYVLFITFSVILITELFILALWLGFGVITFEPKSVIPMSGMIIGNSMIATGLAYERLKNEFSVGKGKILASLALGASPKQASKLIISKTLTAAMLPNIDTLKTIGLVQLPGMMTGLILGGVEPTEAIRYQIVVTISIFTSVSIAAMLTTIISYRFFFKNNMQLKSLE